MSAPFPNLFSEIDIGGCALANRIVFSAHHTYLADRAPNDALIAYCEARAAGGAGLIVSEIVAVHPSAEFSAKLLLADDPEMTPAYRRLTERCHAHGAKMFAQLFHPGREVLSTRNGLAAAAWAPSAVPTERFRIMPRALSAAMIDAIVAGFATAARHLSAAAYDGFEIVANHGYLPAQFLNPRVNRRDDDYGGDFARRLRFLEEVASAVRAAAPDKVLGLRLSADELDPAGLGTEEVRRICAAVKERFDYFSVTLGTSASLGGAVHIVPPMGACQAGDIAAFAHDIKLATARPVVATGRIVQPQEAERIIAEGQADLCGLARALICDARFAAKAKLGRSDDIRACIGCNQACIGRAHKGLSVSCIQRPESGRELAFGAPPVVSGAARKRVLVAGGGVAGMKAAAVAAARGHRVTLFEKAAQLGGQSRLAQALPGRGEFGGIITNLEREMRAAGVEVKTGVALSAGDIAQFRRRGAADSVVVATGATPYLPDIEGAAQDNVWDAWRVIGGQAKLGARVVVADWKADWVGLGLAEMLAAAGYAVRLCVTAALAGEALPAYTRNHHLGRVKKLGAHIQTHLRLFGIDGNTVYFQDVLSDEPVVMEDADSVVLALGHAANDALERELAAVDIETHVIGDSLSPRTAEEAVFDGLTTGWRL